MAPLSLATNPLTDDAKRALSAATLLWAVASAAVMLLTALGAPISYEQALPVVVLIAWLGAEAASRSPVRIPVAICSGCNTITRLSPGTLRRFWPWKYCPSCRYPIRYTCDHEHVLSVFPNQPVVADGSDKPFYCSRCGVPVPAGECSASMFNSVLAQLMQRMPKKESLDFYWDTVGSVLAQVPPATPCNDQCWRIMDQLIERSRAIPSRTASLFIISVLYKVVEMDRYDWRNVQEEVSKKCPA